MVRRMRSNVQTQATRTPHSTQDAAAQIFRSLERYRTGVSLLVSTDAPEEGALRLSSSIRAGLAPNVWSELRRVGFSTPEIASVVGVSEKTISRKQRGHEPLDVAEGDRTMRLAQVTLETAQAFGALDKAMRWLRKPNRVLGGEKPIELIATEPGTAMVRRVLGTIEYGGVA
jgi:putative toxin-antitoxin system antitoxin component (TIGR02293 family)